MRSYSPCSQEPVQRHLTSKGVLSQLWHYLTLQVGHFWSSEVNNFEVVKRTDFLPQTEQGVCSFRAIVWQRRNERVSSTTRYSSTVWRSYPKQS